MKTALTAALLHFLWEGAAIAVPVALYRGSSRVRYRLASAALFAMPVMFVVTLILLMPGAPPRPQTPLFPLPAVTAVTDTISVASRPAFALSAEWMVPLWLAGVCIFLLRSLVSCLAVQRIRRGASQVIPERWSSRFETLAHAMNVSRAVRLLESRQIDVPVVIGFLRPVILFPAGLLAGLPTDQIEFLLIHELAHVRRLDYLVNLLQTVVEAVLFYHPAVWWVSGVMRAERENCCDDAVLAMGSNARDYAMTLEALEHTRLALAPAASGGSLVHRIRRVLHGHEGPRVTAVPLALALVALCATIGFAELPKAEHPRIPMQFRTVTPTALPAAPAVHLVAQARTTPAPPVVASSPQASPWRKWLNEDVAYIIGDEERRAFNTIGFAELPKPVRLVAQARTTPAPPVVGSSPQASPWRKWLNEDVAYIIGDEERRTFNSLATDEEREQFVEQFWLRRDPTPGTAENEYRIEHYRRIAYVNEHYAAAIPGWKTDRGRIYIQYGPPDEIEAHPACPSPNGSFEEWFYKYIQGTGNNVTIRFSNSDCSGEYRMTSR